MTKFRFHWLWVHKCVLYFIAWAKLKFANAWVGRELLAQDKLRACRSATYMVRLIWQCSIKYWLSKTNKRYLRQCISKPRIWISYILCIEQSYAYPMLKKGRPSAGGSHMSGVWGRDKPRQAFPSQNLRRGYFEPTTWWLSETALTTAPGLPFYAYPMLIWKN